MHTVEPGCAVKAAVDDGELSRERFESYLKLREELEAADFQ
jgi:ribosome biogenesis GTPase